MTTGQKPSRFLPLFRTMYKLLNTDIYTVNSLGLCFHIHWTSMYMNKTSIIFSMHFNTDKHLVRIGTFLHILILGLKINKYQSVRQLVFNSYANYTTELQNLGKFGVNYFCCLFFGIFVYFSTPTIPECRPMVL